MALATSLRPERLEGDPPVVGGVERGWDTGDRFAQAVGEHGDAVQTEIVELGEHPRRDVAVEHRLLERIGVDQLRRGQGRGPGDADGVEDAGADPSELDLAGSDVPDDLLLGARRLVSPPTRRRHGGASDSSFTRSTKYCTAGCRSSPVDGSREVLASLSTSGSAAPPALSSPPGVELARSRQQDNSMTAPVARDRRGDEIIRGRPLNMLPLLRLVGESHDTAGRLLPHRGWFGGRMWLARSREMIGPARHFSRGTVTAMGRASRPAECRRARTGVRGLRMVDRSRLGSVHHPSRALRGRRHDVRCRWARADRRRPDQWSSTPLVGGLSVMAGFIWFAPAWEGWEGGPSLVRAAAMPVGPNGVPGAVEPGRRRGDSDDDSNHTVRRRLDVRARRDIGGAVGAGARPVPRSPLLRRLHHPSLRDLVAAPARQRGGDGERCGSPWSPRPR